VQDLADHYADMADLDADYTRTARICWMTSLMILPTLTKNGSKRSGTTTRSPKNSRRIIKTRSCKSSGRRITSMRTPSGRGTHQERWPRCAMASGGFEDEQRSYDKEQDRREEDLKDQIAQLDAERKEKQQAGQQALRDLEAQHRKERAAQEAAFSPAVAARRRRAPHRGTAPAAGLEPGGSGAAGSLQRCGINTSTHYANLKTIVRLVCGRWRAR